jgi:hypothetical protein
MKVHVVVTVKHIPNESAGCPFFGDIILITEDKQKAEATTQIVKERRPYKSLDYTRLASFDDVICFPRETEEIIKNEECNE